MIEVGDYVVTKRGTGEVINICQPDVDYGPDNTSYPDIFVVKLDGHDDAQEFATVSKI